MFQVYSESIKNLVIIVLQVHFERVFEMHLYFFLGQKYTWSRLSKLTNLHLKLEVYLKFTFWIDAFFHTQKYTWDGLSKFMYLMYSNPEVYFKHTF